MNLLHDSLSRLQRRLLDRQQQRLDLSVLQRVAAAGFQVIGAGSHRLVVELPGSQVAKLALRDIGTRDNNVEWHAYWSFTDTQRTLLCPPLELTDSNVLIMRRCLPISPSHTDPGVRNFVSVLASLGIGDVAVNLGVLDGRLVCYDYAQLSPDRLKKAAVHDSPAGRRRTE